MSDLTFGLIGGVFYGLYLVYVLLVLSIVRWLTSNKIVIVADGSTPDRWEHAEDFNDGT